MTKQVELFSAKKFAMVALGNNDKSLCNLVLKAKNVSVTIPSKYLDYTNIFLSDSVAEPPKHTSIDNYPINLIYNCLPMHQTLSICKIDGSL